MSGAFSRDKIQGQTWDGKALYIHSITHNRDRDICDVIGLNGHGVT